MSETFELVDNDWTVWWRPIESAPRDGTRILLCARRRLIEPVTLGFWSMAELRFVTPLINGNFDPDYWTELPPSAIDFGDPPPIVESWI